MLKLIFDEGVALKLLLCFTSSFAVHAHLHESIFRHQLLLRPQSSLHIILRPVTEVQGCCAGLIWVKPSKKPESKAAANANGLSSSSVDTSDIPILPEIDVSLSGSAQCGSPACTSQCVVGHGLPVSCPVAMSLLLLQLPACFKDDGHIECH